MRSRIPDEWDDVLRWFEENLADMPTDPAVTLNTMTLLKKRQDAQETPPLWAVLDPAGKSVLLIFSDGVVNITESLEE